MSIDFDRKAVLTHWGKVIKASRKAAKMSQRDLARRLGLRVNGPISRLERGERWPDAHYLLHILVILNISLVELLAPWRPPAYQELEPWLLAVSPRQAMALRILLQSQGRPACAPPEENIARFHSSEQCSVEG
jgi:transcriptional regulator with XRE-family HTH domain